MIKYEYKVLKAFSLNTNEKTIREIARTEITKNSTDFEKGALYVDYEIPDQNISICNLTKKLIAKNYIKLINTIQ